MASFNDCLEEIAFLTRSPIRALIFDVLHRNGPVEERELRNRFDCDRTTLQRNLDTLTEHEWIEEANGTYRITQAGKLLASGLSELMDTTDTAMRLRPFLQWIPTDEFDIDPELFMDANIVVAGHNYPHGVCSHQIDILEHTAQFRGLFPSLARPELDTIWRRVVNQDGTFEIIITEDVVKTFRLKPKHIEKFDEILESDRVAVMLSNRAIPYYLGISEEVVHIGAEDTNGIRRALLETERSAVRAWAADTYESYKQQSVQFNRESYNDLGPKS